MWKESAQIVFVIFARENGLFQWVWSIRCELIDGLLKKEEN